jgi:hypothetical protein
MGLEAGHEPTEKQTAGDKSPAVDSRLPILYGEQLLHLFEFFAP